MIKLTHVGETLIAEMFNREPAVRSALGASLGIDASRHSALPEIPLAPYGSFAFDGGHCIDVVLATPGASTVIACESKLGQTRLSRSDFQRFLEPCETSHSGVRLKGSMPAILERKLPNVGDEPVLSAQLDGERHPVDKCWALIVRRSTARGWEQHGQPELSERCTVVVFEDLVAAYGGPDAFNALVRELTKFDYFAKWLE